MDSRGPANSKVNEVFGVNAWKEFEIYIDNAEGNGIDMRNVRIYRAQRNYG